jgi:hypothetical protein
MAPSPPNTAESWEVLLLSTTTELSRYFKYESTFVEKLGVFKVG